MYTLYYYPHKASFAVHWLLIHLGVPFTLRRVDIDADEHKSAAYLALNPSGMVPTLIVDGAPYAETTALMMLLAERHPEARLQPAAGSPERASYLQWMIYLANTLLPAYRAWFYAHEPAGAANREAAQASARAAIEAVWDRMDTQLARSAGYLIGAELSALDFLATMLITWSSKMPRQATDWPAIRDYLRKMYAMPSLQAAYRAEQESG